MPSPDATTRRSIAVLGAHESWARTADRTARTEPARAKAPSSTEYWLARLDPERFADATDRQKMDAAEAAKKAHFARLALKSAAARRGGGRDVTA
jgi:hypothetical protein